MVPALCFLDLNRENERYALILPVFGVTQVALLADDPRHWLVRVAPLLVGLGALTLIQVIYTRYQRLKQSVAEQATVQEAASQAER